MDLQENSEKYLQRRQKQIVQSLRLLAKARCLLTGRFDTGRYSFLTVIIDVITEKGLVVLDYGHDEAINSKLLGAPQVVFKTRYRGIKVRFSSDRVEKSNYRGKPVFVVPIPKSLYWLERREFYRIKSPLINSAVCRVPVSGKNPEQPAGTVDLRVANIGPRGVALYLPAEYSSLGDTGTLRSDCILVLPEHSEVVDLEIRHQTRLDADEIREGAWIGCAIVKPGEALQSRILQYMQSIERQRKEFER